MAITFDEYKALLQKHPILNENMLVSFSDGRVFLVPVRLIAGHRAEHYSKKDGVSFLESLENDTIPLFQKYPQEILNWASGSMDWEDVEAEAVEVKEKLSPANYSSEWVNALKKLNS